MSNNLDDLIKRLDKLENNLGETAAPKLKNLFEKSVSNAIIKWYKDYDPQFYNRTYNFRQTVKSARVSGGKNLITMTVDSGYMKSYDGWNGEKLQPSTAFDYFFDKGFHGHGRWLMHVSQPPQQTVTSDIITGFNGQANRILRDVVKNILKK